jgi:hypothetical protein
MSKLTGPWRCDRCGRPISSPAEGYAIWKQDEGMKEYGFKIVHESTCGLPDHACSLPLDAFVGDDGLSYLLSFLSAGPVMDVPGRSIVADLDEFVDFVRRMQLPHYEQARPRFRTDEVREAFGYSSESFPYRQRQLKRIASRSGSRVNGGGS